ncbi:MAG: acyltransferase [Tissierellia bacterium]|nr:acyltransferase [Tissierellia bacterium]
MSSFYTQEELNEMNFKSLGNNVLISRKCSIYSPEKISIGSNVRIDDFCIISGNITLGNYVHIAAFCAFFGSSGITLEDFVGTSSRVTIYSDSDDYSGSYLTNPTVDIKYKNIISGQVTLKKHTIIGASCVILPGVTINEGASVGSMSLVNKDVNSWSIYTGIPAKRMKERKKDLLSLEKQMIAGSNIN